MCPPVLSALLQGVPWQQSPQTLTAGRCTLRADCSLPKNSFPGERARLQPPPPLCHSAKLSSGCFSLPAALKQPKLLLQQGSGAAGRREVAGSGTSLLLLGKQEKLEKENANGTEFTGYLYTFPSRRKGNVQTCCSSQDSLSKHAAALTENWSTRS